MLNTKFLKTAAWALQQGLVILYILQVLQELRLPFMVLLVRRRCMTGNLLELVGQMRNTTVVQFIGNFRKVQLIKQQQ
jgi:hypothetical protein